MVDHQPSALRQAIGTQDEILEELTHLAFYAGWPKALSAIDVAKKVFAG